MGAKDSKQSRSRKRVSPATKQRGEAFSVFAQHAQTKELKCSEIKTRGPKARDGATSFCYGSAFYVFGGVVPSRRTSEVSNDFWKFDRGRWTEIKTDISPPPRTAAACCVDPNRPFVYLLFGFSFDGYVRLSDSWVFDLDKEQWYVFPLNFKDINIEHAARYGHTINIRSDRLYVYGGTYGGIKSVPFAYELLEIQLENGTCRPVTLQRDTSVVQQCLVPFRHTSVIDGKYLIAFGGSNDRKELNTCEIINLDSHTYKCLRLPMKMSHSAVAQWGSSIWFFGGMSTIADVLNGPQETNSAELWRLSFDVSHSRIYALKIDLECDIPARHSHNMEISDAGQIFIFGGRQLNKIYDDLWMIQLPK